MKKLITALLCTIAYFTSHSQCTTATYGQWPTTTYTPAADDSWEYITTAAYNGEYSVVAVVSGQHYQFLTYKSQNGASRYLTITDEFDTPIVSGTTTSAFADTIGWTATFTGNIKFFTHLDAACGESSANNQKATRAIRGVVPPPVNDDPAGAIQLTVNDAGGYRTYSNVGATNTTTESTPTCAAYNGGDVWFYVDVPAGVNILEFDTQTGTITDGGMSIYRGTPGSLTEVECDDDDALDGLMPYIYREDAVAAERIYIRVWEYGGNTFGTFNIFVSTPQALPVELVTFEAAEMNNINVVEWETASENNSSHYELQHSFDGESWDLMKVIPAAGFSNEVIHYVYYHCNPRHQINYYRLVQYDRDGASETFDAVYVDNRKSEKKIIKYINLAGQEVNPLTTTGLVLIVFEDGSTTKMIR